MALDFDILLDSPQLSILELTEDDSLEMMAMDDLFPDDVLEDIEMMEEEEDEEEGQCPPQLTPQSTNTLLEKSPINSSPPPLSLEENRMEEDAVDQLFSEKDLERLEVEQNIQDVCPLFRELILNDDIYEDSELPPPPNRVITQSEYPEGPSDAQPKYFVMVRRPKREGSK